MIVNRLREIEATRKSIQRGPLQIWERADGRVQGYQMALEDLKPVLEAAQKIAKGRGWPELQPLRDALAGLE